MLIALQRFDGERPKVDARLLLDTEAQAAETIRLWSGKIVPWRRPRTEQAAVKTGPIQSIYRFTDAPYWLHWASDVDVALSPIADSNSRFYYTGDGTPKMSDLGAATGQRVLAQTTNSGSAVLIVDRVRGFNVGDSVTVQLNVGTHTATVAIVADTLTNQAITLNTVLPGQANAGNWVRSNETDYPLDYYPLGVPAPTTAPVLVRNGTSGTIVDVVAELDSATESDDTASIALTSIGTANGGVILLKASLSVEATIYTTQKKAIVVTIFRTDVSPAEIVFREVYEVTIQGATADVAGGTFTYEPFEWHQEIEAEDAPASGDSPTYSLSVVDTFVMASGESVTKTKTFSARYRDSVTIEVDTGEAAKIEAGDFIRITNVEGDATLRPINDRVEVLSVDTANDEIEVETDAYGAYDSGGTWMLSRQPEELEARAYVYTYVAEVEGKEMESPPSPVSEIINVGDGEQVQVGVSNTLTQPPHGLSGNRLYYTKKRIYRTSVGNDADAEFLFVAEVAAQGSSAYIDLIRGAELGEPIPSTTWSPPPDDLQGIIELPNGSLAGFRGNELCLSVPNQPHAWPSAYRQRTHHDIVSIAAYGASIVVGTKGRPEIANGLDPELVSMEYLEVVFPNLSKRGTVDMGYGILYPSKRGLVLVETGLPRLITEHLFDDRQWEGLNPASFVATRYHDRYLCFYDNGTTQGGFILDPRSETSNLTFINFYSTEAWTDPETDQVYFVFIDENGDEQFVEWDAELGSVPMRYRWRSKEYVSARPVSMAAAKVDAELYPVTVNIYGDGVLYDSLVAIDDAVMRVSDELGMARKWEVEVVGDTVVEAIYVASSTRELVRYLGA